jgi:hypothetical protein
MALKVGETSQNLPKLHPVLKYSPKLKKLLVYSPELSIALNLDHFVQIRILNFIKRPTYP